MANDVVSEWFAERDIHGNYLHKFVPISNLKDVSNVFKEKHRKNTHS